MKNLVTDFRAIQKRCYEIGILDFKGDEIKPTERVCNRRLNLPLPMCWCARHDGTYDPCPTVGS